MEMQSIKLPKSHSYVLRKHITEHFHFNYQPNRQ